MKGGVDHEAATEDTRLINPRPEARRISSILDIAGGYEAGEVSTVELFSDLVVAAGIHSLSDMWLEQESRWFELCLRVYFIWSLWHTCIMVANIAHLYTAHTLGTRQYAIIFSNMALQVALVKACQNDDNVTATLLFLIGRFLLGVALLLEARFEDCPEWVNAERRDLLRAYPRLVVMSTLIECIPLSVVLVFFPHTDIYLLWGGFLTVLVLFSVRRICAVNLDLNEAYQHSDHVWADLEHMMERYELITLVFLGELCFAASSKEGTFLSSLGALAIAMACFLLYFVARVEGRTEAWHKRAETSVQCPHFHLLLFCFLPSIGVAYVQEKGKLLGIFAGMYIFIVGSCLERLTKDPPDKTVRIRMYTRVLFSLIMGLATTGVCIYWNDIACTVVPALLLGAALVQIWAVQTVE